ncbi:Uncharacterized protein Rs2_50256 [Raphanus sativus]|nr:Uncharacterized protein Rs2_50256 [Raphanus sativus]
MLNDYVRVQVIVDLNQPLRDKKSLTLPGGRVEYIDVEYERVRKKCFHCYRLSHEKLRCPVIQAAKKKGKEIDRGQGSGQNQSVEGRQHHSNLAETLMPLLAPSIPPGFEPHSTMVAPEVFEEMRIYMNCVDPEERRIREARMKKPLMNCQEILWHRELRSRRGSGTRYHGVISSRPTSAVPINRKTCGNYKNPQEALEVVDYVTEHAKNLGKKLRISPQKKIAGVDRGQQIEEDRSHGQRAGGFVMGSHQSLPAERDNRSRGSKRSSASWVRRNQNKRRDVGSKGEREVRSSDEGPLKRKATDEGEVTSKVSKQYEGLMVHQKPSSPQ